MHLSVTGRTFACAALLATALPTTGALAQAAAGPSLEVGAPETATKRYLMGREMYIVGRLDDAAAEFRSAFELFPTSAKLAFNLARTYERLSKLADAIDTYGKYLALSPNAPDKAEVQKIIQTLRSRQSERQAELVLSTTPPGAGVYLDEAAKPLPQRTPARIKVPAGGHILRFHLDGYQESTLTVDVAEKASQAHHINLISHQAGPGPRTPAAPVSTDATAVAPAESGVKWRPIVGYGLVGLGAVGLGLGTYGLVSAGGDADDAAALGPSPEDLEARGRLEDDYDGHQTLGIVGLSAGLALGLGGAAVLLWPKLMGGAATATVTPSGLGVHAAF